MLGLLLAAAVFARPTHGGQTRASLEYGAMVASTPPGAAPMDPHERFANEACSGPRTGTLADTVSLLRRRRQDAAGANRMRRLVAGLVPRAATLLAAAAVQVPIKDM